MTAKFSWLIEKDLVNYGLDDYKGLVWKFAVYPRLSKDTLVKVVLKDRGRKLQKLVVVDEITVNADEEDVVVTLNAFQRKLLASKEVQEKIEHAKMT